MENTGNTQEVTETSSNVTGNTYSSLKSECDKLGISVSKLCREAQIDRSVLERWRKKEPQTLKIYNALQQALLRIQSPSNLTQ